MRAIHNRMNTCFNSDSYGVLPVRKLREELQAEGLHVDGSNEMLIDRLRSQVFKGLEPEPSFELGDQPTEGRGHKS